MKRKCRSGLALALAFVLTGAACMLPVIPVSAETGAGAESKDVKKITVNVQTTDSITLKAEDNYEYAIETEKENGRRPGSMTGRIRLLYLKAFRQRPSIGLAADWQEVPRQ